MLPSRSRAALASLLLLCLGAAALLPSARASGPREPALPHESLPALARDDTGAIYLAVVSRTNGASSIVVSRFVEGRREHVATLGGGSVRAPGRPALAGLARGALVAFSGADDEGRHRVFYAILRPRVPHRLRAIRDDGTRSILPAVARTGGAVAVVWESNALGRRTIRAATILEGGAHTAPVTISSPSADSHNPDVVAVGDRGVVFAAWDSFRDGNWDVYGARSRAGHWAREMRLTSDPRLERHPSVASWNDQVWMAWQAESFPGNLSLSLTERRVLVGRVVVAGGRVPQPLEMKPAAVRRPLYSDGDGGLTRPHAQFGEDGRLWVTARQSLGVHAGWAAVTRDLRGRFWGPAQLLLRAQGRWPKAPLVPSGRWLIAAVQWDSEESSFLDEFREEESASSGVTLVTVKPRHKRSRHVAQPPVATRFDARARVQRSDADAPRRTREHGGRKLSLYWGNLHAHSALSTCERAFDPPPDDLLVLERDLDRLDFVALTDHDFSYDEPSWAYTQEAVARYDDPAFATLLGQEWTSGGVPPERPDEEPVIMRYGHHNIIFKSPAFPRVVHSTKAETQSPAQVAAALEGQDFVLIPHALADWQFEGRANPPVDWKSAHHEHSPLAEIYQRRGSYECLGCPRQAPDGAPFAGRYLRDAWQAGVVIGTIAAPDHGGGEGYAGVWAEDLSDDALFRAFHARHTFGTTGEKTALFFAAGDAMMGDEVPRDAERPIDLAVWAASATPIEEVVVFRNGAPVFRATPNEREVSLAWHDETPGKAKLWYYARVHAAPGTPGEGDTRRLAWSSPIWFGAVGAPAAETRR